MWVRSRQYTGRVVTVSNARIFDEPVYNYTHEFPFLWEEMQIPISYTADRAAAERILLDVVGRHAVSPAELDAQAISELKRRYFLDRFETAPRVYFRLTDNWLELTVRFVVRDRGIRDVKYAITRDLLTALDSSGISIASATFELISLPQVHLAIDIPPRSTALP